MKILERTFGLEVEFVNVEKRKVFLPTGFTWSKDEVVHNTDGTNGTFSNLYGGEINTPPLFLNHETKETLKKLYENLIAEGGKITRELSIQTHIYIGDLELEKVKNIFLLLFYSVKYIEELGYVSDYSKFTIFTPIPTIEDYEKVKKANSFEALRSVFENSTKKGFARHIVNVSSFFKSKTVEFRAFYGTDDFNEVMNCVLFSYRFVQYAIENDEETFKSIESLEDFKKRLKVRYTFPKPTSPLLFYGNPLDIMESMSAKKIDLNASLIKTFLEQTDEAVTTVNPNIYSLEMKVYKLKKLVIYNNDEFNHIIYLVATNQLKIKYDDSVQFIQNHNTDEPKIQLACLLIFHKLKKFIAQGMKTDYSRNAIISATEGMQASITNSLPFCENLIEMFKNVDYRLGTLNAAIEDGGCVFFQFDDFAKSRTTAYLIKKKSSYNGSFVRQKTEYYKVEENLPPNTTLTLVSRNKYLNLFKCAQVGEITFYSSKRPKEQKITHKNRKEESVSFNEPPDELEINDESKLRIVKVSPLNYKVAQLKYINKVHKVSLARFCYFVMYEDYMLGGFGFDIPKILSYDIWLLSDFATNNRVPRLSKLILLCIKSITTKTLISRAMIEEVKTCYTKVYTQAHVSMKYRGVFNKADKEKFFILYDTILGESGSMKEVVNKYQQYKKNLK
jgi:hypothetical protein